jgi:hypothetical protein
MPVLTQTELDVLDSFVKKLFQLHADHRVTLLSATAHLTFVIEAIDNQSPEAVAHMRAFLEKHSQYT